MKVGHRFQSLIVVTEEKGKEYVDLDYEKVYYVVTSNLLCEGWRRL